MAKQAPHFVEIFRQDLAGKIQCKWLAEIELSLVRYLQVLLAIFDVIRQLSSSKSDNSERQKILPVCLHRKA